MSSERPAGCCAPAAGRHDGQAPSGDVATATTGATDGMVRVPAGSFLMGSEDDLAYPDDGESPVRRVDTDAFWISPTAVSNAEFGAFVDATGYRTESERYGWSFVFGGLLPDDFPPTRGVASAPWWRQVEGAAWRTPEGPQSDLTGRMDHPVVHVSWADALEYCRWAGLRLPTEAEWERAARGGQEGSPFPWGAELEPGGEHRMNVWQGQFPQHNTSADGWYGTCPVTEYAPNGFGLHNATGNVWEWCRDRFVPVAGGGRPDTSADVPRRIAKGGSYLCHESYCRRYRVSARQGMATDTSTGNTGFRCARDA